MHPKLISSKLLSQLLSDKYQKRFWSKVGKRTSDECWPWLAGVVSGYGHVGIEENGETRKLKSHRVAWILTHRKNIPKGKLILHSCIDSKTCCNPRHLRVGTYLDNVMDAVRQNRYPGRKGEKTPTSKLKPSQVLLIRAKHSTGNFQMTALAKDFNVTPSCIRDIIIRRNWTHI